MRRRREAFFFRSSSFVNLVSVFRNLFVDLSEIERGLWSRGTRRAEQSRKSVLDEGALGLERFAGRFEERERLKDVHTILRDRGNEASVSDPACLKYGKKEG